MSEAVEHTALPWIVERDGVESNISGPDGWVVAQLDYEEDAANAAFICRAVNSHADLVGNMWALLTICPRGEAGSEAREICDRAIAALAKAGG